MIARVANCARIPTAAATFGRRHGATQGQYVPVGKQWLGGKGWILVSGTAAATGAAYMFMNSETYRMRNKDQIPLGSQPMTPSEFRAFKLQAVQNINHNTAIFRFELPDKELPLSMAPSSFVLTRAPAPAGTALPGSTVPETVVRPYTPTSLPTDKGFFDLLVKRYPGGPMSSHLHALKPGDMLEVKGPIVKFDVFKAEPHDHFAMVAGGTGITPMHQIITSLLGAAAGSNTDTFKIPKMTLIFGNLSEDDILLKPDLDALAERHADKLKIVYLVDKPTNPAAWRGPTGHVTKDLLKKHLPAPRDGKLKIFVCGPGPMVTAVCGPKAPDYSQGDLGGMLKELGYTPDQVFKF